VLPLIIGMAVALAAVALVALVFAWRGDAAVGAVSQRMSRRLTGGRLLRLAPAPEDQGREPPAPMNLAQAAALLLEPLAGGRTIALEAGCSVVLGRGHKCEIVLADDTVSAAHARLEAKPQDQRVALTDLSSSNGTFLNGSRITNAEAQVGDVLRFGNTEFKLVSSTRASAPTLVWMLSGFDLSGRVLQFELRPPAPNGRATTGATWTIGRDPNRAQFLIDNDTVSGAHAAITHDARHGLMLRDLGSTNGTRLNGAALGKRVVALTDKDQEITFGAAKLRLSRLLQ